MALFCRNLLTIFFCLHFGGGFLVLFQGLAWFEMAEALEEKAGLARDGSQKLDFADKLYQVVFSEPSCSHCHAVQEESAKQNFPVSGEDQKQSHKEVVLKLQLCSVKTLLYKPSSLRLSFCGTSWQCPDFLREAPELPPPNSPI